MELFERNFPGDRGRVFYMRINFHGGIVKGRRNFPVMESQCSDSTERRNNIKT